MPIVATIVKIVAREITVEDVPMISGVAILVKPIHKRYPERSPIIVSINMYAAPFPTLCPFNWLHPPSHTFSSL
jgi:hypothetical protein